MKDSSITDPAWYTDDVNRQTAIDAPIDLGELLSPEDLRQLVSSYADVCGLALGITDRSGSVSIGSDGIDVAWLAKQPAADGGLVRAPDDDAGHFVRHQLVHDGEPVGWLLVGPCSAGNGTKAPSEQRARSLAASFSKTIEVVIHNARARQLSAAVHIAAMNDAFGELEEKNQRLHDAVEKLQELDVLKTNFLATISHELRTPLTSVIGYSEMLLEELAGPLNEEQNDYVQTILGKADHLLQLITGILDVSLLQSGDLRIAKEPVAMQEVIDSVVATFAPQARKRRIVIDMPASDVPRVMGDMRKIRQVIWNLIANAIKFTRDGGDVSVDLHVGPLSPDDESGRFGSPLTREQLGTRIGTRVRIRDSGIGISPEKQSHIFEPFFQVDSSSTREYGGTGLGLTLAKKYIEAHGGNIWVDSELGQGSVFTVSLPAVPKELSDYLTRHPLS